MPTYADYVDLARVSAFCRASLLRRLVATRFATTSGGFGRPLVAAEIICLVSSELVRPFRAAGNFCLVSSEWCRTFQAADVVAKLPLPVHVHMLRHSTGYALAARGMDTRRLQHFLGHASITNTVRYTAMSPEPFRDIWRRR